MPESDFPGAGGAGAQPAAPADVPEAATAAALEERCSASQARPLVLAPHRYKGFHLGTPEIKTPLSPGCCAVTQAGEAPLKHCRHILLWSQNLILLQITLLVLRTPSSCACMGLGHMALEAVLI